MRGVSAASLHPREVDIAAVATEAKNKVNKSDIVINIKRKELNLNSQLGFVGAEAEGGERQAQDCLRGRDRRLSTACPHPREIGE